MESEFTRTDLDAALGNGVVRVLLHQCVHCTSGQHADHERDAIGVHADLVDVMGQDRPVSFRVNALKLLLDGGQRADMLFHS